MDILFPLTNMTSHCSMNGMSKEHNLSGMARTCMKTFLRGFYTDPIECAQIVDTHDDFKVVASAKGFNQISLENFNELPVNPLKKRGKNKIFPIAMLEGSFAWWAYLMKEKFGCTGKTREPNRYAVQVKYRK